ncbi:MAG: tetratricopeptide repeat protein [Acidobacteria bacterium]|nr:tetratricopeptide repeat protein [Acidobacteriota bacterium]
MNTNQNILKAESKFRKSPSFSQKYSQNKISSVLEILSDYYRTKTTGTLTLKSNNIIKSISFNSGNIIFATSNLPREQFSEFLISSGQISYQQVKTASRFVQEHQMHIGQALVNLGYIKENKLKDLTTTLISNIIYSTLAWQSPEITFQNHQQPSYELDFSMSTIQLLYKGVSYIENPDLIKQMIGNLDADLYLNKTPSEIRQLLNLQPEENFIISCLDSMPYTTQELINMGSINDFVVLRTVCGLLKTAIVKNSVCSEKPVLSINNTVNDNRIFDTGYVIEFCKAIDLKTKAIDSGASIYELLEVSNNAGIDQVKESYQRLACKFHPSQQTKLDFYRLDFSRELEYIFQKLAQALNKFTSAENNSNVSTTNVKKTFHNINTRVDDKTTQNRPVQNNKPENPQREIMQLCYEIESKYNAIKTGATLYQILGVERDSSQTAINSAFNSLSKRFTLENHSKLLTYGINLELQLEEIMMQLNKAFIILSNPVSKQKYNSQIGMTLLCKTNANNNEIANKNTLKQEHKFLIIDNLSEQAISNSAENLIVDQETKIIINQDDNCNGDKLESIEPNKFNQNDSIKYHLPKNQEKDKSNSPLASTYYLQSMEFCVRGEPEKAIITLRKAIKMAPDNSEYWLELGRIYSNMPNYSLELVESTYKEAMARNIADASYPTELGLIYQKDRNYIKAREYFEKALAINPKQTTANKG